MLWDRDKTLCHLPRSACEGCTFKMQRGPGRPPGEGRIDWNDPESVLAYHREYQSQWRKRRADRIKAAAARFRERHPNYFRDYYQKRKAK